jgi:hypothetical protein
MIRYLYQTFINKIPPETAPTPSPLKDLLKRLLYYLCILAIFTVYGVNCYKELTDPTYRSGYSRGGYGRPDD